MSGTSITAITGLVVAVGGVITALAHLLWHGRNKPGA